MKSAKKILSLVLVVLMLVSVVPLGVSASDRWDVINDNGVSGDDIVAQARTYLGVPYDTSGGNYKYRTGFGDTMMFDCSGFVYRVCRDVGLASSHKNANMGMLDPNGRPLEGQDDNGNYFLTADTRYQRYYGLDISYLIENVNKGDCTGLQAGDLLFFTGDDVNVSHVAIYSGNGTIIHSEDWEGCVAEHPVNRYPTSNNWYFAACRLVKDSIQNGDKVEFNGHYYQVFDESTDWFQAKKKCEDLSGHLVTITSQEEQDFINKLLVNKTKSNYWAGATDEEVEGDWEWITGEEFKYMNWNINEPNNTEYFKGEFENYLHISTSVDNMWNDSYADAGERVYGGVGVDYFGFICEWDSSIDSPCKHTNSVNKPQLDPNCIDIGFTAGVYCNDCETWLSGHEVIAVSNHKDNTGDGKCDTCLKQLSSASTSDKPETPKKNIIQVIVDGVKTVINNVVNFFKKLFGR